MDLPHNIGLKAAIADQASFTANTPVNGDWVALDGFGKHMFAVEVTGVNTGVYTLSVQVADDSSGTNPVDASFTIADDQATFTAATNALTQVLKLGFVNQSNKPYARVTITPTAGGSSRDGYLVQGMPERTL